VAAVSPGTTLGTPSIAANASLVVWANSVGAAEYELSRGKLSAHPKHQENVRKIEASDAIHSVNRANIQKVEPKAGAK